MTRSNLVVPDFYRPYIALVEKDDISKALKKTDKKFRKLLTHLPATKLNYAYAEGKWTIKEVLQHIIDAERVFSYRALWFARKDTQPLPGFNENAWAVHANVSGRKWDDMIDEFKTLRRSTEQLYSSFSEDELKATGTSNSKVLNVEAIGYICAGHVAHHIKIIKERYLSEGEK